MKKLLAYTAIILLAQTAYARILHVPDEYPTITEAIEASENGDTVLVAPGEYWESFDFGGKNILLTSSHGPDTTEIHGRIIFEDGEDSTCILRGFSVIGPNFNGNIRCSGASPIIEGNIIKDNWGMGGAGIVISGEGIIRNNIIKNNEDWTDGGGICIGRNGSIITKNVIKGNYSVQYGGYGGGIFLWGNAYIGYNLFIDNQAIGWVAGAAGEGGGICRWSPNIFQGSKTSIVNNTFVNNVARYNSRQGKGGGIYFYTSDNDTEDSLVIKNNIFAYNSSSTGIGSAAYGRLNDSMYFYWDYNCIYENSIDGFEPGPHDIFLDPLFFDTLNDDFHLLPDSPCIDAGDPDSPLDPDSTRADIGAYYFDQTVHIDNPGEPTGPYKFQLHQNYPNPFNSYTSISYYLPEPGVVSLSIYSITGQLVAELILGETQESGEHRVIWDGRSRNGEFVITGIYFYQLKVGGYKESKALILIK